ncbi:MAG: hypothetical protein M1136_08020 [Chloroflexi bacterium]|nr:hypothetical protein [Chloroflexota bacterium]MCL5075580.1 hypothetical protein [Chloroflexota bacterium]
MFRRTVDPDEREKVLALLNRWYRAIARIDKVTDAMRLTIAVQPLGMQSEEFEKARLAALAVFDEVQRETSDSRFWPILRDNHGAMVMLEFQKKLEEALRHQLNQLRLLGAAAQAFRSRRDREAPSADEMMSSSKAFARVLDDMGAIGWRLVRHYRISAQEYQAELQK